MRCRSLIRFGLILLLLGPFVFAQSSAPAIRLSTNALNFEVHHDGNTPSPLQVGISNSGGGTLTWTVEARTADGLPWLSVTPASGSGSGTLTVAVDPAGLATAAYTGTIEVSASGATNSPQTVTVTLSVTEPDEAIIALSPPLLRFGASAGVNPSPLTIQVQNLGGGALGWTATVSSAGDWLAASPSTGVAPGVITVTASTASLAAGTYTGAITFSALPGAIVTNSPQIVVVSLGIDTPIVNDDGVVNGASFSTDAVVSPGSLASIFGSNLSHATASADGTPLPASLGGVRVEVSGVAAPLYYVSPGQINFQVPTNVITDSMVLRVTSGSLRGPDYFGQILAQAPGIFAAGPAGSIQGAVANQDSSLNSTQNPAGAGSVIQIFSTGLGATDPPIASGVPGSSSEPFNRTTATPTVLIGGTPAEVLFAAIAPGFVGLYQVNARIPAGITPGSSVPLQIQMGGYASNTVTIAVKPSH